MNIFKQFVNFFFPPFCHICGTRIEKGKVVCERCFSQVKPVFKDYKKLLKNLKYLDDVKGFCSFSPPADQIIHLFKYYGRISLKDRLVNLLEITFKTYYSREDIKYIVPVPLHPTRKRERGYNQSFILGLELSKRINIPISQGLKRIRYTTTQTLLSEKEREKNIKDAFKSNIEFEGTILLIDDVFTSGHTLDDCARALKEAGASKVISLVIAVAG